MCVYEAGLLLLFIASYIALATSTTAVELLPRVGAPLLTLAGFMFKAVQRGSLSFLLFVVALAACVYETGLLLVCACRTSAAASVVSLLLGVRALSLSLVGFMF